MKEIKNLPNLGYEYFKDNGKFCFVVLGKASCPTTDQYRFFLILLNTTFLNFLNYMKRNHLQNKQKMQLSTV